MKIVSLSIILFALAGLLSAEPLKVLGLKADHLIDPIHLDSSRPSLSWRLEAAAAESRGRSQSAFQILVSSSLDLLAANEGELWDSGKVEGSQSIEVVYAGKELASRQSCFWKVKVWDETGATSEWSAPARFTMALLQASDWEGTAWIGLAEDTRTSTYAEREYASMKDPVMMRSHPSPLLRKEIELSKPIKRALAYVSGVGYSEFYLNGKKVGDAVLDPGQTNYEKHTLYVSHDVTAALKTGRNAMGLWLGSGFYGQNVAWKEDYNYGQPRARVKLFVEYEDGTEAAFGTDGSWKATTSPIVFDNVYWGETYDARLEISGWAAVGCDDGAWQNAVVLEKPCPDDGLRSQLIPPIREQRKIEPKSVKKTGPGKYIVDFGENLAGWVEIEVEQDAGDVITIVAGEGLEPDGVSINTSTTGGAPGRMQEMIYIAKGEGRERWNARFSYHGFQYIEISGLQSPPTADSVAAVLVHSDIEAGGSFVSSEELLNRQYEITRRTLEANWHSIPEDCPAREKCGWLGDAHATADISLYGYDMTRFFGKFMRDIEDSLVPDARFRQLIGEGAGLPPLVAPGKRVTDRIGTIDWGVAYVLVPWRLYLHTGDRSVFERHYGHLKNFISYYESLRGPDRILPNGLGDWCPPSWDRRLAPEFMFCHPHVSGTAFYFEALRIMGQMAEVLGEKAYSDYCFKLAEDVKDAFNAAYLEDIPGTSAQFYGSQTATVMALSFGMVPADRIDAVVAGLVYDIEEVHGGHHTVGIHGLRHIYTVLSDFGHEALAARMLLDRTFPGPGYLADYGFTTWPERQFNWDEEPRFRNSMNHPMQGGFAAFFFEGVGGIRPLLAGSGYRQIEFRPRLTKELAWAKVSKLSPYGEIRSDWRQTEEGLLWEVEVPVNCEGILYLPVADSSRVLESGKPLDSVSGIRSVESAKDATQDRVKLTVGSGRYVFLLQG